MAFPQGIDYRGTAAFVTDPTNYASEDFNGTDFGTDYPTTTPQGNTVGWETATTGINGTDRSNAVNARLAGVNYAGANFGANTFRVDLPATGSHGIQGAFGDQGFAQGPFTVELLDGATVFATPVNSGSAGANQYFSANGTLRTSDANWVTNNPVAGGGADEITHTFTSTIFRVRITPSGSSAAVIASIFIQSAGSSGVNWTGAETLGAFVISGAFGNLDRWEGAETLDSFVSAAAFANLDHWTAAETLAAFISSGTFHNTAAAALVNDWLVHARRIGRR